MSYAIYIGCDHTADGIAYVAGYGDEPSSHWLELAPQKEHDPHSTVTVGVTSDAEMPGSLCEIPQARYTARCLRVNYSQYRGTPAPITNGGLNEYGVAVFDVWSKSSQALIEMTPSDQTGPNYSDLARLVIERAKSAREGVELIGSLIEEFGHSTYGGNSHLIADAEEAWVVIEFAGEMGLWVAERLGSDAIRASRPGYIGTVPLTPTEDFMYPSHLIDTAITNGWYDPSHGEFNVNQVYGDGKGRWEGVAWIEKEMRSRAQKPQRLSIDDIFWAISTEHLTGDTAGYGRVVPLTNPKHSGTRMMWYSPIGAVTAPLVPVFIGQKSVPPEYAQHRFLTAGESAKVLDTRKQEDDPASVSRISQGVECSRCAVYAFKRLMHLVFQKPDLLFKEVWDHWRAIEMSYYSELSDTIKSASILYDANEDELAENLLTNFNHHCLDHILNDCEALAESAYVRLRALGELNYDSIPRNPVQIR
ncbi:MAG: C69 family dipeptidase [Pseudomonadota bacterium]